MEEKLEVYDLKGNLIGVQSREIFYAESKKEFNKKGKISKQVKSIRLLLMNSQGRIYLQKRSSLKKENPGLYDKTVGGHVQHGDSWNMAVVRECAEELGFPASILDADEFSKAIRLTDLSIVGVFRKVEEVSNFASARVDKKGNRFIQPYITAFFIGYYDGAIRFIDGESSGIEVFSLQELKKELRENPKKFTEDVAFIIKKYEKYLVPVNRENI
jgi:isopentenyldiphosphate isomerase